MVRDKYYGMIISILQGKTPALREIPSDRLGWEGPGALLELYEQADASKRDKIVRAMGQIIELHEAPPEVIAEIIYMAASLDLVQVEPSVRRIQAQKSFPKESVLSDAVNTYLALRDLSVNPPSLQSLSKSDT